MTVWVMRSSRSCLLPCHPTGRGLAEGAPDSTMGTASPWPGPNQRGLCPTGDQALDRKQADTVREVNQALPEVQKSHSFRPKPPVFSPVRAGLFSPMSITDFPFLKMKFRTKPISTLQSRRHRAVSSFAFPSPPQSPSARSPAPHTLAGKSPGPR